MKLPKIIQLIGLLITVLASVIFFATLYGDQATESGSDGAGTITASFLAAIAGVGVFLVGRTIAWWNRD